MIKKTDSFISLVWRQFKKSTMALVGLAIVMGLILMGALAPILAPYDPYPDSDIWETDISNIVAPPSLQHPFGTDDLGRDIFSRIIYGSRISLQVGFIAMLISVWIGVVLGTAAGYYGGWIDNLIMRITDIFFAMPAPLLVIAVMAIFENPSVDKIFFVLGFIGWTGIARLVRAKILSVRQEEYTQAARALGARTWRIILRHVLPNAMAPLIVAATIRVAGNILTEAWLSFLGLGAQPPIPSWGTMVTEGQRYLTTQPWVCVFPGLAIFTVVLGFNLFGDGLRDALDPKLNRQ